MAQNSWPFVGGGGTAVNEDQWSIMARAFCDDGVVDGYANTLQVYGDSSGRQVKVKTGRATVRGHWYENTAEVTLAIGANSSGNPRVDLVVLRLDPSANSIVLAVVQGTPAGSPSAPTLTQTDVGTYEMTLARVAVANGASTIAVGDVTDERIYVGALYAIGVRASGGAVQTVTGFGTVATVSYTGETDPMNILSSGVVTVPTAGLWQICGVISFDADTKATLAVKHNGDYPAIVNSVTTASAGGPYATLTVATALVMAAGDTVRLEAQNLDSPDLDIRSARFTVHRVG